MQVIPYEAQIVQIEGFSCLQAPDFGWCCSLCPELGALGGQSDQHSVPDLLLILPGGELDLKRHQKAAHGVVGQDLSHSCQHY